ncbi:unnamed protein product, partial [Closterium sp. NIES-54]
MALLVVERWVQRALALALCLAVLQLATPVALVNAQLLQASQVQFLQDCQTAWGQTLPGWGSSNPDCSSAKGITCDSSGMVLVMDLPYLNLKGPIPDSISSLRELSIIYLQYNQLTGSIPTTLGVLTNLNHISLVVNRLTGTIPAAIGNLAKLRSL